MFGLLCLTGGGEKGLHKINVKTNNIWAKIGIIGVIKFKSDIEVQSPGVGIEGGETKFHIKF